MKIDRNKGSHLLMIGKVNIFDAVTVYVRIKPDSHSLSNI